MIDTHNNYYHIIKHYLIIDLDIKLKIIKPLEENIGKILCDFMLNKQYGKHFSICGSF